MSQNYTPTEWVDNRTVGTANVMNNMERGIEDAHNRIDGLTNGKLDKTGGMTSKSTYGTYDNACILNVNNTNAKADVLGFISPQQIADYVNRDHVGIYTAMRSNYITSSNVVSFTATGATLSDDVSNFKVGTIVDIVPADRADHSINVMETTDKYSGIITDIQGTRITVSGWFKVGDTSANQIPDINKYNVALLNPQTKLWCHNSNIFLRENTMASSGVIQENGLFNYKYASDPVRCEGCELSGIDNVAFYGKIGFGYKIRKSGGAHANTSIQYGYDARDCDMGHYATGCNYGYVSQSSNKRGFYAITDTNNPTKPAFETSNGWFCVASDGRHLYGQRFDRRVQSDTTKKIGSNTAPIHYVTKAGKYTLDDPASCSLCTCIIYPTVEGVVLSTEAYSNSNIVSSEGINKTLTLTTKKGVFLQSDGTHWYVLLGL